MLDEQVKLSGKSVMARLKIATGLREEESLRKPLVLVDAGAASPDGMLCEAPRRTGPYQAKLHPII